MIADPPRTEVPTRKVVADDLLVMLAERRQQFLEFVRRRVRSGADAEDLIQQALLRASEKLDTLRETDRLEAWFYRVLRNAIADHHAAWARDEARLALIARDAIDGPPEETAVCACSLGVLEKMPADYAHIIRRVDIDEDPIDAAAKEIGITANNAKVRLHRARKDMRQRLEACCGVSSLRACLTCDCPVGADIGAPGIAR